MNAIKRILKNKKTYVVIIGLISFVLFAHAWAGFVRWLAYDPEAGFRTERSVIKNIVYPFAVLVLAILNACIARYIEKKKKINKNALVGLFIAATVLFAAVILIATCVE